MGGIILEQLAPDDREQFILDNQEAFNYGAMVEFGLRDNHLEEDGQIISRKQLNALLPTERLIVSYTIIKKLVGL